MRNSKRQMWNYTLAAAMAASWSATAQQADAVYGRVELGFEANWGQADPAVKFLARGAGYGVLVTPSEAILTIVRRPAADRAARTPLRKGEKAGESAQVRMKLAGANRDAEVLGVGLLPGKVNYFVGRDPSQWRTEIPTYRKVEVRGVYPGVDLVYYGAQRELEYDFVVAPGVDPEAIKLSYEGVEEIDIASNGDLILRTKLGSIRQQSPVAYQEIDGKRQAIPGRHVRLGEKEVGFRVQEYDRSRPLTIDPRLSYSTLLGGAGFEGALALAVDSSGSMYVTGLTDSTTFPLLRPIQSSTGASETAVFVTKLNATGTALAYSTYLHGGEDSFQTGTTIAVNGAGEATVGGMTASFLFPTTAGAYQTITHDDCCFDGFITKLSANGSALLFSTLISGLQHDEIASIAVDATGAVYATGESTTPGLPTTTGAFQTTNAGGLGDAFVLKLNPAGSALVYSTSLGGIGDDRGNGIAIDSAGNAYVTGRTSSSAFPTTAGAYQTAGRGAVDAFLTKVNSTGTALVYSTRLGGGFDDVGNSVKLDAQNNAYVAGVTLSTNFPATAGAYQTTHKGGMDVFVAKVNPSGSGLGYATLLGGAGDENAWGLAVDQAGSVHLGGATNADFPVTSDAILSTRGGGRDGFVTKLSPSGSTLEFSTYLGHGYTDQVDALALDAGGLVYLAGTTSSGSFPTTPGAYQRQIQGSSDVFLAKLEISCQNTNTLAIVSGNNQTGRVGAALASPLIVELRNGCTGAVAGQTVTFASGGATLNPATATTDASGRASTVATLGGTAGTVTITASAPGAAAVTFTETAEAAPEGVTITAAAGYAQCAPAPGMIAVAWGQGFTTGAFNATSVPLPTTLGGASVEVTDSSGANRAASLFAAFPTQINFQFPEETQGGPATVRVRGPDGRTQTANVTIESVCPGLFTQNSSVSGVAAGSAMRFGADGTLKATTDIARWDATQTRFVPQAIEMGEPSDQVILVLFGSGLKGRTSLANVSVRIGGEVAESLYVGVQPSFVGLDQVNVRLPRTAAGRGEIPVVVTVDGKTANTVTVEAAAIIPPPALTSVSPNSVEAGQTVTLTLQGSNMGGTFLEFSSTADLTVTGQSSTATQLTATVAVGASAALGVRQVWVWNNKGRSNELPFTITAPPARVDSRSGPDTASPGETVNWSFSGAGLTAINSMTCTGSGGVNVQSVTATAARVDVVIQVEASAALGRRQCKLGRADGWSSSEYALNVSTFRISNLRVVASNPGSDLTLNVTLDYTDPTGAASSGTLSRSHSVRMSDGTVLIGIGSVTPAGRVPGATSGTMTYTAVFEDVRGVTGAIYSVSLSTDDGRSSDRLSVLF